MKPTSSYRLGFLAAAAASALVPHAHLYAQSATTAGISGVVSSLAGPSFARASVTARHEPTGTVYTAVSRGDGQFDFRGLIPGGPYTITATVEGAAPIVLSGHYAPLGEVSTVTLVPGGDVQTLEEMQVTAAANDLDGGVIGAGSALTAARLAAKPTSERSLADAISASNFVTLRSLSGDREEAQITALGQNNRFNSIQIDGARINDQFGLNATGLASFFNPLSLETVDQIRVSVSPYDIREAGFTGASVNAVTKSGTNEFKGSVYYYFQGDEVFGIRMREANPRDKEVRGVTVTPPLDRQTWGVTLGGPILKNRLFFFAAYEKFETESAGRDPRLLSSQSQTILNRLNQYATDSGTAIDWGNLVTGQTANFAEDEKFIGKIDWNISDDHRLSVRYSQTEGEVPQFGRYASANLNNYLGLSGGAVDGVDGHFYAQGREEKSWSAQLASQWTPDLKTEVRYSKTTQDQTTPVASVAPEVAIFGLSGLDLSTNRQITNGVFIAGTEQFRQGNVIEVETDQVSGTADYFWRDWVFTAGFQREQSDFYNLFRQGSYGLVAFSSVANFLADRPARIERNLVDPTLRDFADISEFATNGAFIQGKWDLNSQLSLLGGLRFEWNEQPEAPTFNQAFFNTTGFRNDGTLDGADYISPRFGFNWALDKDRVTQLRGGVGHFTGRAPWVFFSNSYNNIGVGSFTLINSSPAQGAFQSFLAGFDPANPIATGSDSNPNARREINWADEGVKLPSVWRASIGVDRKVAFLDSILSIETVYTENIDPLFISNENLRPTTAPAADGRQRFAGNPSTAANARFAGYTDLYRIRNVDGGNSWYTTFSWERPMKDNWAFYTAYTRGNSNEVQANGQTTASGQWQRNVVFNQGEVEVGTSDFEIKDRIQASISRKFQFVKKAPTTVSLYFEGRTGNPYSFVYNTDLNGDGRNDNDILAVPSGLDDPRFDFSQLSAAQQATYFANIEAAGLSGFGGGIAPRNGFTEPWVNRLDLKFVQEIPIYKPAKLELFFDFINFGSFLSRDTFGFTEQATLLSNDVFRRRQLGGATYGPDGRIRPTVGAPAAFEIENNQSRWRVQVGARLSF